MDKQELIDKYEYLNHDCFRRVDTSEVLKDLKQLDEPQKPVVSQFVANWYEKNKRNLEFNMFDYVYMFNRQEETSFKKWFNDPKTESFQTLANMHQFGYEVEKEKRYLVKFIGVGKLYECLNFDVTEKIWKFFDCNNTKDFRTHHTRQELEKAGFGEVFNSPLFEVEEVEE